MKIRHKDKIGNYVEGSADSFNVHGMGEIVTYFGDECDLMEVEQLEVRLKTGEWKPMVRAFMEKDILENNTSTMFDFPHSEKEKEQGFNW